MAKQTAITPTRKEDFSEWFLQVIEVASLAEHSPSRGCMVIRPYGYAIWENMQKDLDRRIKSHGFLNAYFPLFIPVSYFEKEAQHVDGFAKECAVVTHHRLELKEGKLVPAGPLEEPLVVRPTSEMIIGSSFSKWVQSWRDLPLLINQWANVVRWEMRTRLFLRTAEFLWQEGHSAHASFEEAESVAFTMLLEYQRFLNEMVAIAPYIGKKSEGEKFPGAHWTYTLEAMMQDGKALQCGTSHHLGQNFAKACSIEYLSKEGKQEYAYTTSFGMTTRVIGALVMTHGDDDGLRLPPAIAPWQIVILPYIMKEGSSEVVEACVKLKNELSQLHFRGMPLSVHIDLRDLRGGEKSWDWVKKGVPVRIEVGMRDLEAGIFPVYKRTDPKSTSLKWDRQELLTSIVPLLESIQATLYEEAVAFRDRNTQRIESKEIFEKWVSEGSMGFALIPFDGTVADEEALKEKWGLTVRCLPLEEQQSAPLACLISGRLTGQRAIVAKSY